MYSTRYGRQRIRLRSTHTSQAQHCAVRAPCSRCQEPAAGSSASASCEDVSLKLGGKAGQATALGEARNSKKKLAAAEGVPRRSPTPVLTRPLAAYLRRSEEIRCIQRGMAVSECLRSQSPMPVASAGRPRGRGRAATLCAMARRESCVRAVCRPPERLGRGDSVSRGKIKKADSTLRSSRAVPHPSTGRALRSLTSEVRRDPVYSTWYGRQRESAVAKSQACGERRAAAGPCAGGHGLCHGERGELRAGRVSPAGETRPRRLSLPRQIKS